MSIPSLPMTVMATSITTTTTTINSTQDVNNGNPYSSTSSIIFIWTVSVFFSTVLISGIICVFRTFFYNPSSDPVEPLLYAGPGLFPGDYRASRISINQNGYVGSLTGSKRKSSCSIQSSSNRSRDPSLSVVEANHVTSSSSPMTSSSAMEGYRAIGVPTADRPESSSSGPTVAFTVWS